MNESTVKKLIKYSQIAKETLEEYLLNHSHGSIFTKYFHLRPTSNGITIVSTLPEAPMRGIFAKNADELMNKLENIGASLSKLVSDDSKKVCESLESLGFKKRSTKSILEEDAQAAFIRGMISNESTYEGIQFVASELNLEDKMRFDIVGFHLESRTLYLFELKKGRTTDAARQVSDYCKHVEEYKESFLNVFSTYPNLSFNSFSKIKGIAVMEFAENSIDSVWEENATTYGVDIWMYGNALSFPKRYHK